LPALFTLDGRPVPRERTLDDWPGYAESRPVRIGNGAGTQHQLDGYGWVIDAAWEVTRHGHRLDSETWRAIRSFADHVAAIWESPDAGIWERRDDPRHHVHSKLMAWLALDRATRIAENRGDSIRQTTVWRLEAERLREDVLANGYDPELDSYTASYGLPGLDASLLLLPEIGFEPLDSKRVTGTIEAVRRTLGAGGPLLYRYRGPDGLPGDEGAFLPCSFWLVEGGGTRRGICSRSCSATAGRWVCLPRRSTPPAAGIWATSPRLSRIPRCCGRRQPSGSDHSGFAPLQKG
jgi:GH15 family glucan-1,4-alpha-glucosidase